MDEEMAPRLEWARDHPDLVDALMAGTWVAIDRAVLEQAVARLNASEYASDNDFAAALKSHFMWQLRK